MRSDPRIFERARELVWATRPHGRTLPQPTKNNAVSEVSPRLYCMICLSTCLAENWENFKTFNIQRNTRVGKSAHDTCAEEAAVPPFFSEPTIPCINFDPKTTTSGGLGGVRGRRCCERRLNKRWLLLWGLHGPFRCISNVPLRKSRPRRGTICLFCVKEPVPYQPHSQALRTLRDP